MILSKEYDFIRLEDDGLHIGAATPGGRVVSFCKKNDIAHFEYLSKLPGTLGGMLKMNAGLKEYEIFNHLIAIRTQSGWKQKEKIEYGYRKTSINEVVFEAVFEVQSGYSNEQYEMFWYLWEEIGFLDWGMQNLEWIMTVLTYNKNLLFLEEIFKSSTFKKIIRNQHF